MVAALEKFIFRQDSFVVWDWAGELATLIWVQQQRGLGWRAHSTISGAEKTNSLSIRAYMVLM